MTRITIVRTPMVYLIDYDVSCSVLLQICFKILIYLGLERVPGHYLITQVILGFWK
jgi:hypothetical protein